jgi:hypothetical protein
MYFCNDGRNERRSTRQIYSLLKENKAPWIFTTVPLPLLLGFLPLELVILDSSELHLE